MDAKTQDLPAKVRRAEQEILLAKRRLAELRRSLPPQPFQDHRFRTWQGGTARLSELFAGRRDLIVVHNMGRACNYCTLWADGLNGVLHHLESRASFVVVSPDEPEVQRDFALRRGWRFRMVSAAGGDFNRCAGYERDGEPMPGVSTFRLEGDKIFRVADSEFGPGDDFCAVWHLFDLLRDGPDGWEPSSADPPSRRRPSPPLACHANTGTGPST